MTTTLPPRSEIAPEHMWNAESVFATPADWQAAYQQVIDSLPDLERFKGHLGDGPAMLAEWLEAYQDLYLRAGHVAMYALFEQAVDTANQESVARAGQAQGMFGRVFATIAFAEPEILALGEETLRRWLRDEPRLGIYEHYIDDLFRKQAHVRSADVEEVLGMATDPFGAIENTMNMLTNSDMVFKPATSQSGEAVVLGQGTIGTLLGDPDREIRRTAWENYADTYLAFKNTLASNLGTTIKRDVFMSRARRYPSSLEAALFASNIPVEVFHNLIDTYKRHIPTWHKYWAIRRRALGVDRLEPYDIWAPLTKKRQQVSYEQSVDWICEGLAPLGENYVNTLRRGSLQDRWVDIYPNAGKQQGAFSFGWHGTYPFILMSYDDTDLRSMSTLAHELGHSMHSYLSWQTQPPMYGDYSIFVAEVASNFNQAMVRAKLMETQSDPDFQLALIEEAMDNIHRYFFIMPTLARFELEVHQREERGEGLTADSMNDLMADLFAEGYGSELHVDRPRVGITWAQFPHLYANYYVFQYATGISAAHALAAKIRAGNAGAADNYLAFLSTGGSMYPIDALKLAGVDMTTPEAVEETFAVLADIVDRLDKLTK